MHKHFSKVKFKALKAVITKTILLKELNSSLKSLLTFYLL